MSLIPGTISAGSNSISGFPYGFSVVTSGSGNTSGSTSGIQVTTWDNLPESNLVNGTEVIVSAFGSLLERCLVRVVNNQQYLVVPSTSAQTYAGAHPKPLTSPTIPQARQWIGRNLAIQNSVNTIGTLTQSFAGASNSACTFTAEIKNTTGRKVSSVRLMIPIITNSNIPKISMRLAYKGNGSYSSPQGSWSQVKWSGSGQITPVGGSYSLDSPNFILSDSIIVSGGLVNNDSLIVWCSCDGGSSNGITLPAENNDTFKPSLYGSGRFASGNFASSGASGTPTWQGVDLGNPIIQTLFEFDTSTNSNTVTNVLAIGDSTFAEVVPFGETNGDGWATQATNLAKTNSKKWCLQSWGQGTFTMTQNLARLQALINSGIMPFVDVILLQGWSWNSRFMGQGGYVDSSQTELQTAKDAVIAASRGFMLGTISPPGQRYAYETIPTDLDSSDLTAYDTMDTFNTSLATYFNIQSSVWDPADHRRFLAANSSDNVHCGIGSNHGQDLQAAAAYSQMNSLLTTMGYSI